MADESHEFAGRTVLVTGATKGIGRATAELLASRGASILALGRSTDDLASLRAKIACRTIVVDLSDIEATRGSVRANLPFDLLVNCAGTTALQPFLDLTLETFDRIMTVNAKAPIVVAQEYARNRVASKQPGAIVNVSSDASFLGVIDHAAYCASKAALDAATRVMANELGRTAFGPIASIQTSHSRTWGAWPGATLCAPRRVFSACRSGDSWSRRRSLNSSLSCCLIALPL